MKYDIQAIPTVYSGVKFRSRLEASWAAFFDILNFKWEYEPFELDGWFPDFLLFPPNSSGEILVEVKPIDLKKEIPLLVEDNFSSDIKAVIDKVKKTNTERFLLLGSSPCDSPAFWGTMGWLFPLNGRKWHHKGEVLRQNHLGFDNGVLISTWKQARNATQWAKS